MVTSPHVARLVSGTVVVVVSAYHALIKPAPNGTGIHWLTIFLDTIGILAGLATIVALALTIRERNERKRNAEAARRNAEAARKPSRIARMIARFLADNYWIPLPAQQSHPNFGPVTFTGNGGHDRKATSILVVVLVTQ